MAGAGAALSFAALVASGDTALLRRSASVFGAAGVFVSCGSRIANRLRSSTLASVGVCVCALSSCCSCCLSVCVVSRSCSSIFFSSSWHMAIDASLSLRSWMSSLFVFGFLATLLSFDSHGRRRTRPALAPGASAIVARVTGTVAALCCVLQFARKYTHTNTWKHDERDYTRLYRRTRLALTDETDA